MKKEKKRISMQEFRYCIPVKKDEYEDYWRSTTLYSNGEQLWGTTSISFQAGKPKLLVMQDNNEKILQTFELRKEKK